MDVIELDFDIETFNIFGPNKKIVDSKNNQYVFMLLLF